eukprot:16346755-Heterocapsa_arctica.AAC.1
MGAESIIKQSPSRSVAGGSASTQNRTPGMRAEPAARPASRSAGQPASQPASKPASQPASQPAI